MITTPFWYQTYAEAVPVEAFNTTLPPEQKDVAPAAVNVEVGAALMVTDTLVDVLEHPETLRCTLYAPAVVAVYAADVAPEITVPFRYQM